MKTMRAVALVGALVAACGGADFGRDAEELKAPGAPALDVSQRPAALNVFITEINYDPAGADTTSEFVEVYNAGLGPVDLAGWLFWDSASRATPDTIQDAGQGTLLRPGQKAVIADRVNDVQKRYGLEPGGLVVTVDDLALGRGLNNTSDFRNRLDTITIATPDGQPVERVSYNAGGEWQNASGNGETLQRTDLSPAAANDGSRWVALPASPGRIVGTLTSPPIVQAINGAAVYNKPDAVVIEEAWNMTYIPRIVLSFPPNTRLDVAKLSIVWENALEGPREIASECPFSYDASTGVAAGNCAHLAIRSGMVLTYKSQAEGDASFEKATNSPNAWDFWATVLVRKQPAPAVCRAFLGAHPNAAAAEYNALLDRATRYDWPYASIESLRSTGCLTRASIAGAVQAHFWYGFGIGGIADGGSRFLSLLQSSRDAIADRGGDLKDYDAVVARADELVAILSKEVRENPKAFFEVRLSTDAEECSEYAAALVDTRTYTILLIRRFPLC